MLSFPKEKDSMEIQVYIPQAEFEHFQFDFNIENRDMVDGPMSLYLNHGDRIPTTQLYDIKGRKSLITRH
jgi:hypothetical protein